MAENKQPQYVGSVKKVDFKDGTFLFNVSLKKKDRNTLEKVENKDGYSNLVLQKSKEKGVWYLSVSTFEPTQK